jgi:hypothetical protein
MYLHKLRGGREARMASIAAKQEERRLSADHRFFLISSIVMAATIALGFSTQLALGRSSFSAPIGVHIHALVFFGWTVFYVLQNALVASGSVALHRRLGWLGAGWATVIVLLGTYTTVAAVRRATTPFFFEPGYFLFMNSLTALGFGALTAAAIKLRRRTAWHRRLLLCGMAILTGPAFGRLLPMPLLIPYASWGVFVAVMLFPIAGIVRDWRRSRRIHPAWWWGAGTIVTIQVAIGALAYSGPGLSIYGGVTAGSPGAAVAPLRFPEAR